MSDVLIFAMGCLVSIMVAVAVGLLLWAAGNEPKAGEVPVPVAASSKRRIQPEAARRADPIGRSFSPGLDSKSPA